MAQIRIQRRGGSLTAWAARVHKDVARVVQETTDRVEEAAVRDCPVDTGRLQRTVQQEEVSETERRVTAGNPSATEPEGAHYAEYVHNGTSKQAAQPWLAQAAEAERDGFVKNVQDALRKA